jgi:uncharacterized protein
MRRFENAFARCVLAHRWLVIVVSLLLVGLASIGIKNLYLDSSYEVFFATDNPQLRDFQALERIYSKDDNILIALAPRSGDVFSRASLAAIEDLTRSAWQVPYSHRVDSISNFQYSSARDDDLLVEDMVKDASKLSDIDLTQIRHRVLAEPSLLNRLISPDGRVTGINIKIQIPHELATRMTPEVVDYVRRMVADWKTRHVGIDTYLTGIIVMDNALSEASLADMQGLVPMSFAVMAASLGLLIGGWAGTGVTLVIIGLSTLAAMGLAGYAHLPITPPTSVAPIIILTVAVANCVHLLTGYREEIARGQDRLAAMEVSLRHNLWPVLLCTITTAIGFLTLNFSDIPPFNQLGTIVASGVVVAQLLAITFLPAAMTYLPIKVSSTEHRHNERMARLADFVIHHSRALLWGSILVIVALTANVPRNELNDVFVEYFDRSLTFRTDTDFVLEHLTGLYTVHFSLAAANSGGIAEPDFLRQVEDFAHWLEQQPEVIHVDRITQVLARLNRNMHGDDPAYYQLPGERELAAQYLLLYEMSLPYGLDLNNQIDVDKSATKVSMILRVLSSEQMLALEKRALARLASHAPAVTSSSIAGTALMFSHIGGTNIRSMLWGTLLGIAGIAIVLMVALRSVRVGLLSLLPNVLPAGMAFGIWGIFVGEVGLSLSLVTSMTLGIVIDDTIHFLANYSRNRRELKMSARAAIRLGLATVGRAHFITATVLVLGFLILGTSSFALNSGMGLMTALVIVLALLAEFLFLPSLLLYFEDADHDAPSAARSTDHPAAV